MVAWNEYKAIARQRGALALELFVAESTPLGGSEAVKANLADHLEYIRSLEEAGKLMMAGPLSDASGEEMEGAGMIVLRAASMDEARALADADPMHQSGARGYRMRKWLVNEGCITLRVGLSTGRIELG